MAMRWRSCERAFVACIALMAVACVSTVTRYYVPDAHNPQFDFASATATLDRYVRVQCPAILAAKKPVGGTAGAMIQTDTSGAVTRAELTRSSGDAVLDDLFGTVAAQLKVDSLRAAGQPTATRRLYLGYHCAPEAIRATLWTRPR